MISKKLGKWSVTGVAAALMWAGALSASLQAATYTYDESVPDWFSDSPNLSAWTIKKPRETFFAQKGDPNQICFINQSEDWHLRLKGDYAGAQWEAPAGQVITQIEYTYSGIYGEGGAPQIAVLGGTDSPDVEIFRSDLKGDMRTKEQTEVIDLKPEEHYRQIRLLAWFCDPESTSDYYVHPEWFSKISNVKITTVAAPQ